jgi:uncharacterized protein YPO0396
VNQRAFSFADEQFRMTKLQVYNWGTFENTHTIPIAPRGFLFVGHSGTGKSTLLDAISALLVPPRFIEFNAAAREGSGRGDRNPVSYVRGLWGEQRTILTGDFSKNYLRTGTTWSALALTFQDGLGKVVVLAQVLWIKGTSNAVTDVKHLYLVFEREFDIKEFEVFGLSGVDARKLKQAFPGGRDEFNSYCERFRLLLGIDNETALRLLHKTQSAKNLGDLNTLLREYMLEKPETFAVADTLVNEFVELKAAHAAVVTAGEQIRTLVPARAEHQKMETAQAMHNELRELREGVDLYCEARRLALLQESVASLRVDLQAVDGSINRQKALLQNREARVQELEGRHKELGGGEIEQLESKKKGLEEQRDIRNHRRSQVAAACKAVGWRLPETPEALAELAGNARKEIDGWKSKANMQREEQFALVRLKESIEQQFKKASTEARSLQTRRSNISSEMLDLRSTIAAAIKVDESELPFVGELLEVKGAEVGWRGAGERLLHGFALSLLVDEANYAELAKFVNDAHLGQRLVYYRTEPRELPNRTLASNSFVRKLDIKDGRYSSWLRAELHQRYDYACVMSIEDFQRSDRAITQQGQIKHSRTRHEKDDRWQITDRSNWILGFDNSEKRALYEGQARELAGQIASADAKLQRLADDESSLQNRALHYQTLANIQWVEIDVVPLMDGIATLDRQIRDARKGNAPLTKVGEELDEERRKVKEAKEAVDDLAGKRRDRQAALEKHQSKIKAITDNPSVVAVTPFQEKGLAERLAQRNEILTLDSIDRSFATLTKSLSDEMMAARDSFQECQRAIERIFDHFKRTWPAEASDVDASIASAPDYFGKLERLEVDRLPEYQERFFNLLDSQSHQNLAALSTHLNQARKDIMARMELVNQSLGQTEFNKGTYLRIQVDDRQLEPVREFRKELQAAISDAWTKDREVAERRFQTLKTIVDRLSSQELKDRQWREVVLDVREHVDFVGREQDREGNVVEVYRSGAGKSGGQRQKLATACLAAALRYQLGGRDQGVPTYAAVVLDEAFDKADNEFTTLAMNIFTEFGFQMIVATPFKSVMTLEPFIGGACVVQIEDRKHSGVLLIEYDMERQKLKLPAETREATLIEDA